MVLHGGAACLGAVWLSAGCGSQLAVALTWLPSGSSTGLILFSMPPPPACLTCLPCLQNGDPCRMPVNATRCPFCPFHVQASAKPPAA